MRSLRVRLHLVALLLAVVPLALAGGGAIRWLWTDKEDFVFQTASLEAATAAREVGAGVHRASEQLGQIARLASDARLEPAERRRLAGQLFASSGFLAVAVAAEDGSELYAESRGTDVEQLADVKWAPSNGVLEVRNLTLEPGHPITGIARSIPDADRPTVRAAAVLESTQLVDLPRGGEHEVLVLDRQGKLLLGGTEAGVSAHEDFSTLPVFRKLREGGQGAVSYGTSTGRMLGGYASAGPGQLGVIVQVPQAAVTQAVVELVRRAALLLLLVLVLALAAAVWLSSTVAGPVSKLTAAAQALSRGDFQAELPPPGQDEIGQLTAAFAAMRRELRQRETELRDAEESLVHSEKMSALGQLAAGITHEVKNPLTGIIGFAQLAREMSPPDSPVASHLEAIEREGKRSRDILENLMRFARKEELLLEDSDLSSLVAEALRLGLHQLQLGKVRVVPRLDEELPTVRANPSQLQQVFLNLMLNAMHAMQPKGGILEVTTSRAPDGRVYASFKDEGHGIREQDKKKLFTPFFTTKSQGMGTGLGLSVSYGIVKDHGGEIKVFSQPGVGSVFYVYLPSSEGIAQVS